MTTFWLARHAAHDWLGRGFAGRLPDVALNAQGRREAGALVERLASVPVAAIYCSPQPRTQQTAHPIAAARGLDVGIEAGFDEIDFGDWTGKTFDDARGHPAWAQWVERRASARPPGGEPFAEVPVRAMEALRRLAGRHPESHVLVVSHGDVLKAIVATVLGMPLDHLERFDIAPASLTQLRMGPDWMKLLSLNEGGGGPPVRP